MEFIEKPQPAHTKLVTEANEMSEKMKFLHWPLEFPEIVEGGGFDVVLGNPPWDEIQAEETAFFTVSAPEIASLTGTKRKEAINSLSSTNPSLAHNWFEHRRTIDCNKKSIRSSGRFPLTATGKLNTYSLFAELCWEILSADGRMGIIVPTKIATMDSNKKFFGHLTSNSALVSVLSFEKPRTAVCRCRQQREFLPFLPFRGSRLMNQFFPFFSLVWITSTMKSVESNSLLRT